MFQGSKVTHIPSHLPFAVNLKLVILQHAFHLVFSAFIVSHTHMRCEIYWGKHHFTHFSVSILLTSSVKTVFNGFLVETRGSEAESKLY